MAFNLDLNFFNDIKSQLIWEPMVEWIKGKGSFRHLAWKGFVFINGKKSGVPHFFVIVKINEETGVIEVFLYINTRRSPSFNEKWCKLIDRHIFDSKQSSPQIIQTMLLERYGIDVSKFDFLNNFTKIENDIQDISETQSLENITLPSSPQIVQKLEVHQLVHKETLIAVVVNLYKIHFYSKINKRFMIGYQSYDIHIDFKKNNPLPQRSVRGPMYVNFGMCKGYINDKISSLISNGFVSIPENANINSWGLKDTQKIDASDYKNLIDEMENSYKESIANEIKKITEKSETTNVNEMISGGNKIKPAKCLIVKNDRYAQSEWYSGNTPDPKTIERYLGGPNVDTTQIKSVFIGVDDAINLVNMFDSSLLANIGFIFNFSNQGAYGVYLPILDDKIKREKIKSVLKQDGCKLDEKPDGSFLAYSETKTSEKIQKQIDSMYDKLNKEGGHVFGVNMNKVLMASRSDANAMNLINQEDIDDIITLHLGATIAHEAVHAKGSTSEGPSEQVEQSFFAWALPIVNKKRMERFKSTNRMSEFSPLIITPYRRGERRKSWYKQAQNAFPVGAQFGANIPEIYKNFNQFHSGLMYGDVNKAPIETMLEEKRDLSNSPSRHFPLEKKISLINAQQPAIQVDKADFITEILLEKDRKEYDGYKLTEKLLEDQRPKPIILPKFAANKIKKIATLFGWFSNLDLPMRERIIPKEESDDFLNFDWNEIKKLPRYNHEGEQAWFEPRFQPEAWDQMISNRPTSFINPARRFAQGKNLDFVAIANILNIIQNEILFKKIMGTRIICSEDILPFVKKFFEKQNEIKVLEFEQTEFQDYKNIVPVWIYRYSIPRLKIKSAENYFRKQDSSETSRKIFNYITGKSSFLKKEIIKIIINMAKNICKEYKIEDVFIVGGFPRSIVMKESWDKVHDLDFSSAWPDQCLKFGGMLADVLGVQDAQLYHRTMTLSWEWMGIKCDFRGNFKPLDIRALLRKHNIKTTPLNMDVYGRDFTINMLIYDINKQKIYDVCKQGVEDIKRKQIRTYFSPEDEIIEQNPIIILRALKYQIRYDFIPEHELGMSMKHNKELLFDGRYSKERIGIGFLELLNENIAKAIKLLQEYGLMDKCKEYIKYANAN